MAVERNKLHVYIGNVLRPIFLFLSSVKRKKPSVID